jgi:hypothetical protein
VFVYVYYGKAQYPEFSVEEAAGVPLREVVDDVLGLRSDLSYLFHIDARYWPLFAQSLEPAPESLDALEPLRRFVNAQLDARLPERFLNAAREAERGIVPTAVADELARVRHIDRRSAELADWAALAAWALELLVHEGAVLVRNCELCERAWLPRSPSVIECCQRPAPATSTSCRRVCIQRRYLERNREYYRERRRLYMRMKRGLISKAEYDRWLASNRPGEKGTDWNVFEPNEVDQT